MDNIFSKFIDTELGPREFTFRQIYGPNSVWFLNSSFKSYFRMEAHNGEWKILEPYEVPKWILNVETELALAITDSL